MTMTSKKRKLALQDGPGGQDGTISNEETRLTRPLSAFEAARARLKATTPAKTPSPAIEEVYTEPSSLEDLPIVDEPSSAQDSGAIDVEDLKFQALSLMSTWKYTPQTVLETTNTSVIIRMKHLDRITNVGTYTIKVVRGKISLNGAELSSRSPVLKVFASATQALPVIECCSTGGADVKMSNYPQPLRTLGRLSPLFRCLWNGDSNNSSETSTQGTFDKIDEPGQDSLHRPLSSLTINEHWNQSLDSIINNPTSSSHGQVILVAGPKNVGKSTFAMLSLNRLISRLPGQGSRASLSSSHQVFLLELDPEKSNLAPAGQMSLLRVTGICASPQYLHSSDNNKPIASVVKAHAVSTAILLERPHYIEECIADLLRCYHKSVESGKPSTLIIDTPALDIRGQKSPMKRLLEFIRPTKTVYLHTSNELVDDVHRMHTLSGLSSGAIDLVPSQTFVNFLRTDAQLQDMHLLAHFHQASSSEGNFTWNSRPVLEQFSTKLSFANNDAGFVGILLLGRVCSDDVESVLEGSLITVVATEDPLFVAYYQRPASTSQTGIPLIPRSEDDQILLPDPCRSRVLGLGLVRNLVAEPPCLNLILPADLENIIRHHEAKNIVVIHGCLPNPTWALKENTYFDRALIQDKAEKFDNSQNFQETLGFLKDCHVKVGSHESWLADKTQIQKAFLGRIPFERSGLM